MHKAIIMVGLLVVLAGCQKQQPASEPQEVQQQQTTQDPNTPDSFGVVKICSSGNKIYLLNGGAASGQYAIWDSNGNGQWELLAPGVSPESVCER